VHLEVAEQRERLAPPARAVELGHDGAARLALLLGAGEDRVGPRLAHAREQALAGPRPRQGRVASGGRRHLREHDARVALDRYAPEAQRGIRAALDGARPHRTPVAQAAVVVREGRDASRHGRRLEVRREIGEQLQHRVAAGGIGARIEREPETLGLRRLRVHLRVAGAVDGLQQALLGQPVERRLVLPVIMMRLMPGLSAQAFTVTSGHDRGAFVDARPTGRSGPPSLLPNRPMGGLLSARPGGRIRGAARSSRS
jgi:hypothetical protein